MDYLKLNVINYSTAYNSNTPGDTSFTGFGVSVKNGGAGFVENAMAITPQGNIGFGTVAPASKLHIIGDLTDANTFIIENSATNAYVKVNTDGALSDFAGFKFAHSGTEKFVIQADNDHLQFKKSLI